MNKRYVLITAAHNEEKLIARVIQSVVAQTLAPARWVIVSDGSTDRTDEIVSAYAKRYSFIRLLRISKPHSRDFAAQVDAINAGYEQLKGLAFDFISNLDADITIEPTYFEALLANFERDPKLGLAGGFLLEDYGRGFETRRTNSVRSVPHGVQCFRRTCFEEVGGYLRLEYGGPDWVAEVTARQKGWEVRSLPDMRAFHHRPTGTGGSLLRYWYRQGKMDYALGSLPSFEIVKCARRVRENPFGFGAGARWIGFVASWLRRSPRLVSKEFVEYLRQEQRQRLRAMIRSAPRTAN